MVLSEKSLDLLVVNGVTGEILGYHSIPLFRKKDLSMAYLVVNAGKDREHVSGQYLVNCSDIIYINEKHAIAVRSCVEETEGEELSLDEYTEMIGLPVRYDDGTPLGRLTELYCDEASGAFDLAIVESEKRTTELLHRQIKSADNIEVVVSRRLRAPAEKPQPSRIWFRRLVADPPIVEEPVLDTLAFDTPQFESAVPEKTPEELIADENARAVESLDALLREMEGASQPGTPAVEATETVGLFTDESEPKEDVFTELPEREIVIEPVPEETLELNEKFELKPETEPAEPMRAQSFVDNIPLYQQKFADNEEEEATPSAPVEQPKKGKREKKEPKTKNEKGGARSLWKFNS